MVQGVHLLHQDVREMHRGLDRMVDHVVRLNRIVKAQQDCVDRLIGKFEES